jgi:hypothetical protein
MIGHWIEKLFGMKVAKGAREERPQKLDANELAGFPPRLWEKIQTHIIAATHSLNQKCSPDKRVRVSLGAGKYSLFIRGRDDADSLAICLSFAYPGVSPHGGPLPAPENQVILASIHRGLEWTVIRSWPGGTIPADQIEKVLLEDLTTTVLGHFA